MNGQEVWLVFGLTDSIIVTKLFDASSLLMLAQNAGRGMQPVKLESCADTTNGRPLYARFLFLHRLFFLLYFSSPSSILLLPFLRFFLAFLSPLDLLSSSSSRYLIQLELLILLFLYLHRLFLSVVAFLRVLSVFRVMRIIIIPCLPIRSMPLQ